MKPSIPYNAESATHLRHPGELTRFVGQLLPETDRPSTELPDVPAGWTLLLHGTDTDRWQIGEPVKTITGMGLSAITLADREDNRRKGQNVGDPNAYDTTRSYAQPRANGARPVEVRILFYEESMSLNRRPDPANLALTAIKAGLSGDKQRLIRKYHEDRHARVPRGERLISIHPVTTDPETGRLVEYFIPESVAVDYLIASARARCNTLPAV